MQIIFWANAVLIIVTAAITYLITSRDLRREIADEDQLRRPLAVNGTLSLSMVTLTSLINSVAYYQFQSPVALWMVTLLCLITIMDFLKTSRRTPSLNEND